jgi:hypothetical protein
MRSFNLQVVNFTSGEYAKKLEDYHKNGGLPGHELGFKHLSPYYTHKESGVTDWTGFPSSGKTYFVLEILIQLSERYNKRHMLYVPDLGTEIEVMAKLLKMYTGKDFETKWNNQIQLREIFNRVPQISKDFILVRKSDIRKPLTPQEFWEYAADYRDELGRVNTCLIDSWKNMYHDLQGKREDQYLDYILSYRNDISEQANMHIHTIAHATKTEITEQKKIDGTKKRRVPSAEDIKGGNAWYANGKNIITIDRVDDTSTTIDIHIWKTKPENVGKKGKVLGIVGLNLAKGRYYEMHGGNKYYAFDHEKVDDSFLVSQTREESLRAGVQAMKEAPIENRIGFSDPFKNDKDENDLPF